ncbi:DUF2490 domain-containing protein [Brevundimonas sp. SL161]|uniref:DUF2490 domain-containing protein n=1 Tax=Brevundimonas sp. SL161 TaxID=2804613 RepID=UPI003CF0B670
MKRLALATSIAAFALATPALASDEDMEFWFNPSVSKAVDGRTSVELETAQRFRKDPRTDTYFVRGWIKRDDARDNTWGVGIEQRWNGPDQQEVRLLQQVGYELGPIDLRTRMEQRFVSTDAQTGWRVRQRIGTSVPLGDSDTSWSLTADAELFVTLRSTDPDGQTGVTGLRTFVGFEREFGRYEVSLGYLRQQDVRDNAPDRIGHAPFIGVGVAF